MNVWIMNLKDNRANSTAADTKKKFDICKSKGILGIGWASDKSKEEEKNAYQNANSAIDNLEIGDLVWVRNTTAEEGESNRYICRITATAVTTTDAELNSLDIGKFCNAEFYPAENIPDGISENDLVLISTIRRANENVSAITQQYINSRLENSFIEEKEKLPVAEENVKNKSLKKVLVPVLCVLAAVVVIFSGVKVYKFINMKTHPALPEDIKMGMSFDEFNKLGFCTETSLEEKDFRKYEKDYFLVAYGLDESDSMKALYNKIFGDDNVELTLTNIYFNEYKVLYELYGFHFEKNKDISERMVDLARYYSRATGKKVSVNEEGTDYKSIIFDMNDVNYEIIWRKSEQTDSEDFSNSITFTIKSQKYAPYIPEISSETLNSAFNKLNYNVGGVYNINLRQLINTCVTNQELTYERYSEGRYNLDSSASEAIEDSKFADYLATSYILTVHGDVCSNPDFKYLITEDIDAIKILMYFDDSWDYKGYTVLEESSDFNTFGILYATQSSRYYY